jgi:hypothetical protein
MRCVPFVFGIMLQRNRVGQPAFSGCDAILMGQAVIGCFDKEKMKHKTTHKGCGIAFL